MKGKPRRTKNQKLRTSERNAGFVIREDLLMPKERISPTLSRKMTQGEESFFKRDLTKTLVLTMLVLALELALWQYLT